MFENDSLWRTKAEAELIDEYGASEEVIDVVTSIYGSKKETYYDLLDYYAGNNEFNFEAEENSKPSIDDFEDDYRLERLGYSL